MQLTLDHLRGVTDHVIPQIVKAKLVVGAKGDIGSVRLLAAYEAQVLQAGVILFNLRVQQIGGVVLEARYAQAQQVVDGTHPLSVAPCQVVIDCDQVSALAIQGVQIKGKGSHQCFALAGSHLSDPALVKDRAAHELSVKMALAYGALGGLPRGGERLGQQVVQCLAVTQALFELLCLFPELVVG